MLAMMYFSQPVTFLCALGNRPHRDVDHRKVGAWVAAIAAYFIAEFQPLTVGQTAHLVVTFGLGAALIRFGMLKRRAHRDD